MYRMALNIYLANKECRTNVHHQTVTRSTLYDLLCLNPLLYSNLLSLDSTAHRKKECNFHLK